MKKWQPQNMRVINTEDSNEKGVCYEESKQTWVSLHKHVSEEDILITCTEESIHEALRIIGISNKVDVEQEEWFVEKVFWAMQGWILT